MSINTPAPAGPLPADPPYPGRARETFSAANAVARPSP